MIPIQRILAFAAFGAALTILPVSPVRAGLPGGEAPPVVRLGATGTLRAGDVVEMSWAPQRAGVEELELLLSLDGGRSWHVRVSPELPGGSVGYRWTVPNLPSADARIRIRLRVDGEELLCPAGQRFSIQSDPSRPLARALFAEGAWWCGFETPFDVPAGLGAGDGASLNATRAIDASEEGPRFTARPPAATPDAPLEQPEDLAAPPSARADAIAPETYPLRN